MLCLARMIWQFASIKRQHVIALRMEPNPYVPGDACLRGNAFGFLEPVRLKISAKSKVARCNWRSNQPGYLTLIRDRDNWRGTIPKGERRARDPMSAGSDNSDAVPIFQC
jgi:hypothetical protein